LDASASSILVDTLAKALKGAGVESVISFAENELIRVHKI
jgi:hypothetical protein